MNITEKIMSIDVEDWYNSSLDLFDDTNVAHGGVPEASVVDNTIHTLDLLDKTGSKGTFFILGTVAEHYPDLIREIGTRGHEIASHGYAHNLVYKLTPEQFRADIEKSLHFLSQAGFDNVLGYRAPYWSITKQSLWALDILRELGFRYDSSIFPIRRGLYGIPDATPAHHKLHNGMWEFPPVTFRLPGMNLPIAGGGYLRLIPYRFLKYFIDANRQKHAVQVFYMHPYELDPTDVHAKHNIKSVKSSAYLVQQIMGRNKGPDKLRRLFGEYTFTSIEQILDKLAGDTVYEHTSHH